MRFYRIGIVLSLLALGCGNSGNDSQGQQAASENQSGNAETLPKITGDNVMELSVNGRHCSKNSYVNKPCVSVRVCVPGTSNCKDIDDVLLDTGSYGLRVFSSELSGLSLPQIKSGNASLAECAEFGSGSDWGPVAMADVVLANEPAVKVPIQIIDSNFSKGSTFCPGADQSPATTGFNGILGVGPLPHDCSTVCTIRPQNRMYYACTATSCQSTTVSLANQLQNPIALLPVDNNGLIVMLPNIPLGGKPSAEGYVVLGIGTQSNNQPSSVTTYPADPSTGDFLTTFNGQTYASFLDTGTNGIAFSPPKTGELPECQKSMAYFFCPANLLSLSAVATGINGSPTSTILFSIGSMESLAKSQNLVFSELGQIASGYFDWGLPFHFGKNVYIGISGKSSPLGDGPYFAF